MSASWHNRILGTLTTVAMVMQKPSKSMDIAPILLIFARYGCLIYINVLAKNEENLPSRFRGRPHSNTMATRFRLRIWMFSDVIVCVTSRDVFVTSCNIFVTSSMTSLNCRRSLFRTTLIMMREEKCAGIVSKPHERVRC